MMVCLIFHTVIIINRKNWRITIKLHFENLSKFFFKKRTTHMLGPPSPSSFLFALQWPPSSPPQRMYFLNDPLHDLKLSKMKWILTEKFIESYWLFFKIKFRSFSLKYEWLFYCSFCIILFSSTIQIPEFWLCYPFNFQQP